ncbi:MAG: membrane protein insertion efficiency factor YidD [Caldicoprobacterales bacterium]|nr:membrane protein insertion efficiency factor YidD [Clostridiales bacterium]
MKKILLGLIRFYRRRISSWFPPSCRFYPTCSQYSMQAIEKYGSLKGIVLSLKRILKCNPLHPGGYDPLK